MVKNLLIGTTAALAVFAASAETKVYQSDEMGDVAGISSNGMYAVVSDEGTGVAYLWSLETGVFTNISDKTTDPDAPLEQQVLGTAAYGVADDGTVVGCITYADGVSHPAIYKDGEWTLLPMSEHAMNTNSTIGISADGKYIGGYQFYADQSSDIGGRYRPCLWTLQEDGTYSLNSYENLDMLDHQGFFPRCMSFDGKVMGGTLYVGIDSTMAAYIDFETGQMHYDHTVTIKEEPWIFRGKYYCGVDENGKQIWSEDPNDPRIVLFPETYIDGIKNDDEHSFAGYFNGVDNRNCFYGVHSEASNVDEEAGTGDISTGAAIFDSKTGEWTNNFSVSMYANGLNKGEYIFGDGDRLWHNGEATTSTGQFGFYVTRSITGLYKASADGRVLGGSTWELHPATQEPIYYPLIVVLDEAIVDPTSGVKPTVGNVNEAVVTVADGMIDVQGASSVAVYDMQGRLVSRNANTKVAAGIYLVEADGKVCKVLVR